MAPRSGETATLATGVRQGTAQTSTRRPTLAYRRPLASSRRATGFSPLNSVPLPLKLSRSHTCASPAAHPTPSRDHPTASLQLTRELARPQTAAARMADEKAKRACSTNTDGILQHLGAEAR